MLMPTISIYTLCWNIEKEKTSSESPEGKQIIIIKCLMSIVAGIMSIRVMKFIIWCGWFIFNVLINFNVLRVSWIIHVHSIFIAIL